MEDLKKELEQLQKNLEASVTEKAKKETEAQIESVKSKLESIEKAQKDVTDIKTTVDEIKVKADETDKQLKAIELHIAEQKKFSTQEKTRSFASELGEALEAKKDDLKSYNAKNRQAVSMNLKAVGNMGSGSVTTSGTDTWVGAQQLGGVGRKPYEVSHIRDFVRVTPIESDAIFVIRDAGGEGGPTAVAMAAAKPQTDRDYVKLIQPVTKIAHYFKIPEEMLADIAWLQSEISGVGVEELMAKEDNLLLFQASGAGTFAGLATATNSTAYSTPAALAAGIESANNYDALVAAWTQLKVLKGNANLILMNPADYAVMLLTKDGNNNYIFGAPNSAIPNVLGVPVVPHNEITADKFLLGDFSKATIGQRAGVSVRFYDQNEDDAIKNMVTVVIEERLTVAVDRADRIIYGDFGDAKTALETA
jgi:HK97 family phage major capsid protein